MQRSLIVSVLVTIALVGIVPGAVPAAPASAEPAAAGVGDVETVRIVGAAFGSAFVLPVVSVQAGDSIVWENLDPAFRHSALSWDGSWTTGPLDPGAASDPVPFPTPGAYVYTCGIHPQTMLGVVQVT